MDGFEELHEYKNEPITKIDLEFLETSVNPQLLNQYLSSLHSANTVGSLHHGLIESILKLKDLKVFSECNTVVEAGRAPNTALVKFSIPDKKWWSVVVRARSDMINSSCSISGLFRNMRQKADITNFLLDYSISTNTYGCQLSHTDGLFSPKYGSANYSLRTYTEKIDQNISHNVYGGQFTFKSRDKGHIFEIGKYIRTNQIDVINASSRLLDSEIPVSIKNFASHTFKLDNRDDVDTPASGHLIKVKDELALSEDSSFHKIRFQGWIYWLLYDNIVLENHCDLQHLFTWSKVRFCDMLRFNQLKGFSSVGIREPSQRENSVGDSFGSHFIGNVESKLCFYDTLISDTLGVVPFLYANAAYVKGESSLRDSLRGSFGVGLLWNTIFGKLEFTCATKVWGQSQDTAAGIQLIIT